MALCCGKFSFGGSFLDRRRRSILILILILEREQSLSSRAACGKVENLLLVFHSFHGPGISTAALLLGFCWRPNCSLRPPRFRQ